MPRPPLPLRTLRSWPAVARRRRGTALRAVLPLLGLDSLLLAGIVSIAAVALKPESAQGFVLGTRTDHATAEYPRCLALGDLSGDGRLDVAVVDFQAFAVTVLLGDGLGGFSARTDYAVGFLPLSVAIGDLTSDGRPDLVVANYGNNSFSVFPGDGLGGLGPRIDFVTGLGPFSVAIGDLNLDRIPDVVTVNYLADSLSVLLGNGAGGFVARTDIATGHGPRTGSIGDLNGDGRPDLVVTNYFPGTVGVLLGDGDGGFGPRADFPTGAGPFSATIGDVSGDGKPDVAVANSMNGMITVLLGDGAGGFPARIDRISAPGGPVCIAMGDVTGDARPDVLVVNNGGTGNGSISIFPADGAGGLGARSDFTTGPSARWVGIGDLNEDGRPDLVVSNRGTNTVSVLLGNEGGEFGAKTDFATGGAPASVSIGDLSGDGKPDLASANSALQTVSVKLGDGLGGFGASTSFAAGAISASIAIADVSNDGKPDLAVANSGDGTVSILLGEGSGNFGAKTDFATGSGPRSVAIADVSGDGKPDLAVTNGASNTVSVLLGNGAGGFGPATSFATGGTPTSVAIADVSGDGKPDLAVANASANTVSVLLGDGAGGFGPKTDFVTASRPRSVAIGHLNGDGMPDLVVSNSGSQSVSVLLGDGAGGFGPKTEFAAGTGPVSAAIGDVNGDGRSDLVVADSTSSTVSVLLGDGAGSFGPRIEHTTGNGPVSVTIGDVNGDGRLDLGVANHDASSVSVLLGLVPTKTMLAAGPDLAVVGSPVSLSATVSVPAPGYGAPSDSMRFFDGLMLIGTAPVSGGVANLVLPAAHLGDRSLTAIYKGDGKLFGSIAAARALRVVATYAPAITDITDVKEDQGRHVSLRFDASAYDYAGSATPITGYEVYRALPGGASMAGPAPSRTEELPKRAGDAGRLRTALEGWTLVMGVGASTSRNYQLTVPTLADSNGAGANHPSFMVRALSSSPGVFYDSAPDSGWSVDNLPPAPPAPYTGAYEGAAMHLHWGANSEPDLCCYRVHRGDNSYFVPGPVNLIATLSDTGYADPGPAGRYYKLIAVDVNGNASPFAMLGPGGTLDVAGDAPMTLALERVQPNPSRGGPLLVRFTLPTAAPARLELLDVSGRRVLARSVGTLGPGRHALDLASGQTLAAGIYLLRLSQGASVRVTRVALLR